MNRIKPKHIIKANYADEFNDLPSHAKIEISQKLYKWIIEAQRSVIRLEAYSVSMFDYTPDWMVESDTGDDVTPDGEPLEKWDGNIGSINCCILVVTSDSIYWTCNAKYTDTKIETETIPIAELDENFKVCCCKKKELPLLMDQLKFDSSKEILDKRLQEVPSRRQHECNGSGS